jgi:hypothetical protein
MHNKIDVLKKVKATYNLKRREYLARSRPLSIFRSYITSFIAKGSEISGLMPTRSLAWQDFRQFIGHASLLVVEY